MFRFFAFAYLPVLLPDLIHLRTEKSDYANSLSEEQTEESPEPSKASPVYRITKELWDDNTIIEYTYNQDLTPCSLYVCTAHK